MIEAHIITLPKSKHSMSLADRCITNLKETFGFDNPNWNVSYSYGVDKYSVWQTYIDSNLNLNIDTFGVGNLESEIATFFSHLNLWQKCLDNSKKFLILETDSVFTKDVDINQLLNFDGDLLNLGYPNWGSSINGKQNNIDIKMEWLDKPNGILKREFCENEHDRHSPHLGSCHCDTEWLFGAHCYLLNPSGAKKLLDSFKKGIEPADTYISQKVLNIYDLLPHPAKQLNDNSFIQRHYKHNGIDDQWDY